MCFGSDGVVAKSYIKLYVRVCSLQLSSDQHGAAGASEPCGAEQNGERVRRVRPGGHRSCQAHRAERRAAREWLH